MTCTVETEGAYITELKYKDTDLFYPLTVKEQEGVIKKRGGMHLCLPQFGKDDISFLPQHGYAREIQWNKLICDDDMIVLNSQGVSEYTLLEAYLSFRLYPYKLESILTVRNNGDTVLKAAPGWHPYFSSARETAVLPWTEAELRDTVFLDATEYRLNTGKFNLSYCGEGLNKIALWTDCIEKYICLEPNDSGLSFLRKNGGAKEIHPKEKRQWKAVFEFSEIEEA